ncbi:hypothetical protein ACOZ4F_20035, partial [Haloarcula marismortui]|uniref:hypothetical protein n=1 Tax=Haloarcula marismortui TaxID=2238 RepID=UPI003C74C36A
VDEFVESYLEDQQLKLVVQRAVWLHERQRLLDIAPDDMDADVRFEAWDSMMDYFRHMTLAGRVSFPSALEKASLPDRYDTVDLSDYTSNGQPLPDGFSHLDPVLYDTPLFDAPDGDELRGVVTLWAHHQWLRQQIDDDTPSSRLDELAPTAKDILYAGTVLDRLAVQLYGFDW